MRVADWKHFKKELLNKNIVVFGGLISTVSANPAILSVSRFREGIIFGVSLWRMGVSLSGEGSAAHKTHVASFGG
jgi:hypothetical protein